MKFFTHFSVIGFSNSFIIGRDEGGDAILIDPGIFDAKILELIENNGLYIRYILVTHNHHAHVNGIKTIMKIYDAQIYSYRNRIMDTLSHEVREGDKLVLNDFEFTILETPGHSADSISFLLGDYLFTGDTLSAGMIGTVMDGYSRGLLLNSIREKILTLDDNVFIFPGHGPPSRVGIERKLNPYIKEKL